MPPRNRETSVAYDHQVAVTHRGDSMAEFGIQYSGAVHSSVLQLVSSPFVGSVRRARSGGSGSRQAWCMPGLHTPRRSDRLDEVSTFRQRHRKTGIERVARASRVSDFRFNRRDPQVEPVGKDHRAVAP